MAKSRSEINRDYNKKNNYASQKEYGKKLIPVSMKLNPNTDADIIEWLASQDNKVGYIKSLIRADIER